jgi:hypothetical protein
MRQRMGRRDLISLIEGFYLCQVVYYLHQSDALRLLRVPTESDDLAAKLDCDADLLKALLEFVYQRTDILYRNGGKYQLSRRYASHISLGFHLDKFVGAYGPAFSRISDALRSPDLGRGLIDSSSLAAAFTGLSARSPSIAGQVLTAWSVDSLLDLGCGPALLLIELGAANPEFHGWGVDGSLAMCSIAEREVSSAELSSRIEIIKGDVRDIDSLNLRSAAGASALHAGSLLNEFFRNGSASAVGFLTRLRTRFPGRLLFVSDYFGKLARVSRVPSRYRHNLLQDAAQAISGQGVPPSDLEGWVAVYEAAGCSILDAYRGESDEIEWFLHVVLLQPPSPH